MTLRIQKGSDDHNTTVRLSGRLVASHCRALSEQIESSKGTIVLDLEEVTLVDLDIVQFLARCEAAGSVELLHCPRYVREWISRENDRAGKALGG
jgi:anti-anti-sigma regulatory factor